MIASPRRNATTPRAHAPKIASSSQGRWRSRLLLFFIFMIPAKVDKKDSHPEFSAPDSKDHTPTLV
ncbi:hypothetical protein EMIT0P253_90178 [Pseudomonas sp. IT-P253]